MTDTMQLTEQHIIKPKDPRFAVIDQAAFASKNLYNLATYLVRQEFIEHHQYLPFATVYHLIKESETYQALPHKVSQLILKQVDDAWQAFFGASKAWQQSPEKFLGCPQLPGYKDKQKGRNLLIYNDQAISRTALKAGLIIPSQLGIEVQTKVDPNTVNQVRIVPHSDFYAVEVVYTVQIAPKALDPGLVAGVDIGVNNLAAVASNKGGFKPLLVNGRPLKSINQSYNKRKAELQARLPKGQYTSHQINHLTTKRNWRVKDYLHTAARRIIDLLVSEGIGTLVIGQNVTWKQEVNLGKRNNQNFVQVPHAQFVEMLTYKAHLVGMKVIVTEESYTSKTSFLDLEPIQKQVAYLGKRVKRGLFRAATGRLINADTNAAYNLIRKVIPNGFADGIRASRVVVHPVGLVLQTPLS